MNLRRIAVVFAASLSACGGAEPAPVKPPTTASTLPQPAALPSSSSAKPPPRADASLLPRKTIFGNPERALLRVSPDGKQLAWLAPKDGVLNVWVAPTSDPTKARAVSDERVRPVPGFSWAFDSAHILYSVDKNGDENAHVYSIDVAKGTAKDLTPFEKIQGRLDELSDRFPSVAVVGINDRDPKYHDLYRVDLVTGQRTLLQKNEDYAGFALDSTFKVRFAEKQRPDGGLDVLVPDGKGGFAPFQTIPYEDSLTTNLFGIDHAGTVYFRDSRGRDTGALVTLDPKTKQTHVLAEDPRADVGGVLTSPADEHVQAAAFDYERRTWKVLDKSIEPDMAYLKTVVDGDVDVLSRSHDDKTWTVAYVVSDGPVRYYLYDRAKKQAKFLFTNRPLLESAKLAKMYPVMIPSRDSKTLVSYLSLPPSLDAGGKPSRPLPLVLSVHGGPWGRDGWGLNAMHQWLTSRGYAVLSVNFRGSTGFGKAFVNAGDREWAAKMHDDLIDAVEWAAKEKIAERDRVAIMGGSYGGYATLVGLTFTPDVFACGVDIVGPANLNTLLATIPPYWAPMFEMFAKRVGDPRTDDGKKFLVERSPLSRVGAIKKPLLIGQGANDPRVKQAESDQIVNAMKSKNLPVSYVLFPDEGHGFARPENRLAFFAVAEIFLAAHLGGVYQPVGGDFEGASITVPEGAAHIPGLAEALPKK
jgi:dipeptidyl aminopeptidase/acylaminoacyl peptidase